MQTLVRVEQSGHEEIEIGKKSNLSSTHFAYHPRAQHLPEILGHWMSSSLSSQRAGKKIRVAFDLMQAVLMWPLIELNCGPLPLVNF